MKFLFLPLALALSFFGYCQCDNGTNYFPTTIYSPIAGSWGSASASNTAGHVIQVSVVLGDAYEFSTCAVNGLVAASYDTQLTLRDESNSLLIFNDDECGLQSSIIWTATYTGTAYLHLNEYPCVSNAVDTEVSIRRTDNSGPVVTSYIMPASGSNTITPSGCSGNVFDPGENSDYPSSANGILTILPESSGSSVSLDFINFNTESGYDALTIYNGSSTSDLIGIYDGTISPGVVTSSSSDGALTLVFTSDGSVQKSGFKASISCVVAPSLVISNQNFVLGACQGASGASQSFTVDGTNMESALNIVAPSGVEVSSDNVDFSSSISVGGGGTIATTPIYIRQSSASSDGFLVIDLNATNLASKQISVRTQILSLPYLVTGTSSNAVCQGESVNLFATPGGADETITSGMAIPDNDPVGLSSTVTLSNSLFLAAEITSIEVNLTHTFTGDLSIELTAPNGSAIILASDNGINGDNYTNTLFKTGGSNINLAEAPFSGVYAPEEPFSNLSGSSDGIWTLTIVDDANADTGTLIDWRILKGAQVDASTFSWSSNRDDFSSENQNPTGVSVSETTDFSVTVVSIDGCESEPFIAAVTAERIPAISSLGHTSTDFSVCGASTYDVLLDMDAMASGTWTESPSGATLIQTSQGAQTLSVNPTGAYFNTDIRLVWTQSNGLCAGNSDEVVIRFNQPASIDNADTDSYLWGGLSDNDWSTGSNWYKWDGMMWSAQNQAPNAITSKIFTVEEGTCISSLSPIISGSQTLGSINISDNSEIDLGSASLIIDGDILNNGILNAGTSSLSFVNSSSDQTISGNGLTTFNNLTVSKSAGNLILNSPVTVKGTLDLQSNILNGSNVLSLGTSSTITGFLSNNGGVVLGKFQRYFANNNDSYIFPVGTSQYSRDVAIDFTDAPGDNQYLTISYNTGIPQLSGLDLYAGLPFVSSDGQTIQNYDDEGYWEVVPGSSSTGDSYATSINSKTYNISIRCNGLTDESNAFVDKDKVRMIKSAGPAHTSWEGLAYTSVSGNNSDFTVTSSGSGFSFFGAGTGDDNALPVELVSFSGSCNVGEADLFWQTASEFNSYSFELEYSRDGIAWNTIYKIPAAGFSTELINYAHTHSDIIEGDNYYRLTQYDIDGASVVYENLIVNANCNEGSGASLRTYPNPSSQTFNILLDKQKIEGSALMRISDTKGHVVHLESLELSSGMNIYKKSFNLSSGIYYLTIESVNGYMETIKHSIQ